MYPKRLSCSDVPTYSAPRPVHRLVAAHEGDAKLRRAYSAPDTLMIPGGTGAGLEVGQQYFVRRLLLAPSRQKPSQTCPVCTPPAGSPSSGLMRRRPGSHRPRVRRISGDFRSRSRRH
jgi:hypothetical protein